MYFCVFTTAQRQKFPAVFNVCTTLANCDMIHVKNPQNEAKYGLKHTSSKPPDPHVP